MGVKVNWLDDSDNVSRFNFGNTLFITEGQVDKKIPVRTDCFYVLHNCETEKYKEIYAQKRCIVMQVYTDDVLGRAVEKLDDCVYFDGLCLYIPWATDLLPHEIEKNKPDVAFNRKSKKIYWVGSLWGGEFGNIEQIDPFRKNCAENGIKFIHAVNKSMKKNIKLIKKSYLAPAIVGRWQQEKGYIPCRIFKNISYGQFGLTNSPRVSELFSNKIALNTDTYQLFNDAKTRLDNMPVSELHQLMDFVAKKHTYLNRISSILDCINKI